MLKLCRVTKVMVLFLVLIFVFNFDLFKFSAAILEKGLLLGLPMRPFFSSGNLELFTLFTEKLLPKTKYENLGAN